MKKILSLLTASIVLFTSSAMAFADTEPVIPEEITEEAAIEMLEEAPVTTEEPAPEEEEETPEPVCLVTFSGSGNISYTVNSKYDGSGKTIKPNADGSYSLEEGIYSYYASASGYIPLRKVFLITERDILYASKKITISLAKKTGNGPEPTSAIFSWSDEVISNLYGTNRLPGFFRPDTPAFRSSKGAQEFTTEAERSEFLKSKADSCPYIYLYYLDDDKRLPVVYVTTEDLSSAQDAWEAAQLMSQSDKLSVYYQAQIHGNETGTGEGALNMISQLAGSYGSSLTKNINLYIIPYINPDASEEYMRAATGRSNMNRDALRVKYTETQLSHELFNIIKPEVAIDSHEFELDFYSIENDTYTFDDIKISGTCSLNVDEAVNKTSQDIASSCINACNSAGFRAYHYRDTVNNTISRAYYGLHNCCSILIESVGLSIGKDQFDRRLYSEYVAVKTILDYASKNSSAIKSTVHAARAKVVEDGKVYNANRKFVLKHGHTYKNGVTLKRPTYHMDGTPANAAATDTYYSFDKSSRSRSLPTAYVISKRADNVSKAMKILSINGIEYFEIGPGSSIEVSGYKGNGQKASILAKKYISFMEGAYVIPMDQEAAMVAAAMLEPDVSDTKNFNGSLVQSGILKASSIKRFTKKNPSQLMDSYIKKSSQKITASIKNGQKFTNAQSYVNINGKCSYGKVTYESSNPRVMTVSSSGKASIRGCGTATITITAPAGANFKKTTKSYSIRVVPDVSNVHVNISTRLVKHKGIKVYASANTAAITKLGYRVKYKFYRYSYYGYKPMVIKSRGKFYNRHLRKGRTYYYKAVVLVYNRKGKVINKTNLSQSNIGTKYYGW